MGNEQQLRTQCCSLRRYRASMEHTDDTKQVSLSPLASIDAKMRMAANLLGYASLKDDNLRGAAYWTGKTIGVEAETCCQCVGKRLAENIVGHKGKLESGQRSSYSSIARVYYRKDKASR